MESTELDEKYFLVRAQQRVDKKDFKRAINDFTRAIRINPENDETYLLRAKARVECELYVKAIKDFNSYLECNSNNVNAFLDRGDCYLKVGSKEQALKDFNEAYLLGSELGRDKKEYLESFLKNGETYIKKLSKEINHGTTNPKTYFLRAMAYKNQDGGDYDLEINDFNKFVDYDLVIDDLNKCIDLDPKYEDAYFERYNAKNILSERFSKEEIESDLEKYNSIRFKRINTENLEADIQKRHQKIKNNPLIGDKLKLVIFLLKDKYSDLEISEACGYKKIESFYEKLKSLNFKFKNQFNLFEKSEEITEEECLGQTIEKNLPKIIVDKSFIKNSPYYLDSLEIFKKCLCNMDSEHGGTVYIPTRIVNNSKEWDYSKSKLKNWDLNSLINDNSHYAYQDEETARECLDFYTFTEPMKFMQVNQYWYLNEDLESDEWFEHEEIAEFHGLRYEDCDQQSSWCDG